MSKSSSLFSGRKGNSPSFPTVFAGKQDGAGIGFGDEIEERLVSMENDVHSGAGGSFHHPG